MRRSNQMILESLVVGALILGVLVGGSVSTSTLPHPWVQIQNPQSILPVYNATSLAIFYNNTLNFLSLNQNQNVSQALSAFQYLVVSPALSGTAQNANSEIASMNQSIPELQYYLNETEYFYGIGSFGEASLALSSLCSFDQSSNASLSQLRGPTSTSFNASGVPINIYHPPVVFLQNEINSYYQQCLTYRTALNGTLSSFILKISSAQTPISPYGKLWVNTGGNLNVSVSFEQNGKGLAGQAIFFQVGGDPTSPTKLVTSSNGSINGTLTIPYFYQPFVLVWAAVQGNSSSGIPFVISNILNMTLLYSQTQIIINDPPQLLPTFPFVVSGTLKENSTGKFLPNAPVRITSFGSSYFTTTNSQGVFSDTLTVPGNATDGLHYIYANFAPKGAYGPSVNFTSIVVYRMPINLTLKQPTLIIPGLPTTLSGVASANGSALDNAQVLVNTPWGILNVATDSKGEFHVPISVPLTDFGFNLRLGVAVIPSQAYFSGASANLLVGLLNLVTVVVIILAAGFGIYQARNLGVHFPRLNKEKVENQPTTIIEPKIVNQFGKRESPLQIPSEILRSKSYPQIIKSYLEALVLAERKFSAYFTESMTIRETALLVSDLDKRGEGSEIFTLIAVAAEDYLYSEKKRNDPDFLASESKLVQEYVAELKSLWKRE